MKLPLSPSQEYNTTLTLTIISNHQQEQKVKMAP